MFQEFENIDMSDKLTELISHFKDYVKPITNLTLSSGFIK